MSPEERFHTYIGPPTADDCWPWLGARETSGHGKFKVAGRTVMAHRYSYQLVYGVLTPDQILRHTCDHGWCVNPAHMVPGTHADNVRDRVLRGHSARGERNGRAILTAAQVIVIRRAAAQGTALTDLARRYGVHRRTIDKVVRRENWRHIA